MNHRRLFLNNSYLKFGFFFSLAMILVAGLWPFNFCARNEVEWLKDRNGVHFYGQGIIFSAPESGPSQSALFADGPITIEFWVRPDRKTFPNFPRILSVYDGKGCEVLFMGQWKSHFGISAQGLDAEGGRVYRNTGVENVLSKGEDRYFAITADEKGTRIYIDGQLSLDYPGYSLLPKDRKMLKHIVVGNSPTGKSPWKGHLYGMAFYRRALTAEEVNQHFEDWGNGKPPSALKDDSRHLISYFPFRERGGTRIRDLISSRDLLILPGFQAPQKVILAPPWKDFRLSLSLFSDIMTNILGFIPFGFFISVFFRKRMKSGLKLYISGFLLGLFLSLFVEITQIYLPTRNSQLMDVLTNAFGTSIGIFLFHIYHRSGPRHSIPGDGTRHL
jgi:hypothetical protein